MARRRAPSPAILGLLLIVWGLLLVRLDAPWFGLYDENGAWIGTAVRNYRLYGALELRGLQTLNTGPVESPDAFRYYNHHPPLIVWTTALAGELFGFHEASARWVAAAATLISVAAIYALARKLYKGKRPFWAAALYALTPAMLYFGRMPDHECLTLALGLLLAAVWVDYLRRPTRGRWLALAGLAILAVWTSWAGLLVVIVLAGWGGWRRGRGTARGSLGVGAVGLLALGVLLAYYQLAWPGTLPDLMDAFVWRTSSATFGPESPPFTALDWIGHLLTDSAIIYTPIVLILAGAGIFLIRREAEMARHMLIVLAIVGFGYLILLRNASYIHSYYKLFLAPPLALAASGAVAAAFQPGLRGRVRLLRPLVAGLLVAGGVFSLIVLDGYHRSGEHPFLERGGVNYMPLDVAAAFGDSTRPADRILSNLKRTSLAIEFYAFRDVTWSAGPEDALAALDSDPAPLVYAYCGEDEAPPALAAYPVEERAGCLFYRLRGESAP